MGVVNAAYGHPMKEEEEASAPLAGGIVNNGYQCGMLWGASLTAGAEAYRRFGAGPEAECEAVKATEAVVEVFKTRTQEEINCSEVTEMTMGENMQLRPFWKARTMNLSAARSVAGSSRILKSTPLICARAAVRTLSARWPHRRLHNAPARA